MQFKRRRGRQKSVKMSLSMIKYRDLMGGEATLWLGISRVLDNII